MFIKIFFLVMLFWGTIVEAKSIVVFMSDTGKNSAEIGIMKGLTYSVDNDLVITDLLHSYDIDKETAGRILFKSMRYYPKGTVFVTLFGINEDNSKPMVVKTVDGYYIVTKDNGLISNIVNDYKIEEVREISLRTGGGNNLQKCPNREEYSWQIENVNGCLYGSDFTGRDIFAYVGAKLASGMVNFLDVGVRYEDYKVNDPTVPVIRAHTIEGEIVYVNEVLGRVFMNINIDDVTHVNIHYGAKLNIQVRDEKDIVIYGSEVLLGKSGDKNENDSVYMDNIGDIFISSKDKDFLSKYNMKKGDKVIISRSIG